MPVHAASPNLHHVVIAVAGRGIARAAALFTDLGFQFSEFDLDDVGLRVLLDWDGGLELVTPLEGRSGPVADFLARQGDGVYSLVIRVADAPDAETVAARYGATTSFRQHRQGDGWTLEEIELSVLGLPVTLLSTDLP
jgi:methylmalonyl-CoA/ethylmalonyl-CoA epimerase